MDGTFDQIEYWAGIVDTLSNPLPARCRGLQYDAAGYLYLSMVSDQTISGGSRFPPASTYPNTILVKLTASPLGYVWGYQDPALNVGGFSRMSSIVAMPDHSLRILYTTGDVTDLTNTVRFAQVSSTGVLIEQHALPGYISPYLEFMETVDLCRTPDSSRIFFLMGPYYSYVPGVSPPFISFGEFSLNGTVLWEERNTTYNPPASYPLTSAGLAATNQYLWVAYDTLAPILDQVQTAFDDSVLIEFNLRECPPPTEPICLCPPRRAAQEFRTMHHRNESDRILREAVRCPLHFQNRDTGGLCSTQHATVHSTSTTPYSLHTRRPFHRISGIEEI
jgi:hypothetical protein